MSGIASVIEKLLLAAVVNEKVWTPRRNRADWALAALFALLAGAGTVFLLLALDRYLGGVYPPYIAALLCTAALFIAAFITAAVLAARRTSARKRNVINDTRGALAENIHTMLDAVYVELENPVRENPKTSVLLATLAGFFLANHHMRS